MADEVPVCDVLCEAMEYLSKLGSNLRARSENLKEKRIRKDKLKNQHAVQKAADKVLLICQLSKKSLENVECGVRKVLTLVSSNKAGVRTEMSPPPRNSTKEDNDKYRYFKYRSHKLRVVKKVPVRHYMSVRVLARNMSPSMQDKYPVYYNCKLYRMRRKLKERLKHKDKACESTFIENSDDQNLGCKNGEGVSDDNTKDKEGNLCSKLDERSTKISKSEKSSHGRNKSVSSDIDVRETKESSPDTEDHSKNLMQTKDKENTANIIEENIQPTSKKSSKKTRIEGSSHSRKRSVCSDNSERVSTDTEDKKEKLSPSKDQANTMQCLKISGSGTIHRLSHSSSSSADKWHTKKRRKSNFKKICVIDDDDSSDNSNELSISKRENILPHSKRDKIISDGEKSLNIDNIACPSPKDKSTVKSNDSDIEILSKNEDLVPEPTQENDEDSKNNEKVNTNDTVKPLIKCVSISKLLKPDILEKIDKLPKKVDKRKKTKISEGELAVIKNKKDMKTYSKPKSLEKSPKMVDKRKTFSISDGEDDVIKNKNNIKTYSKPKRLEKSPSTNSDEEFWINKRKEASAFVAKKFIISVSRLPKLSQLFLQLYNLKKIIQNNEVIFEIANPGDRNNCTLKTIVSSPKDNMNVVKHALLNESDSEKSDISLTKSPVPMAEKEKTVRDLLLIESDKEKDISTNADESRSKETAGEGNSKELNSADKVKNALLNDSDSDNAKRNTESRIEGNKKTKKGTGNTESILNTELTKSLHAESDSVNDEKINPKSGKKDDVSDKNSQTTEDKKINQTAVEDRDENIVRDENPHMEQSPIKIAEKGSEFNKSDEPSETTPSKRKKHKRKHMMESIHAKKMLLTYSSSSDTEDELLRNALKEIKNSLLQAVSSSEDEKKKDKKTVSSSDTEEDIWPKVKTKRKFKEESSQDSENGNSKSNEKSAANSKSTSKKMGRSRAQPGGSSQNSDNQDPNDKDIDGLTNLNNLSKNRRRRDSTSTNTTDTNSIKRTKAMVKTPHISEEVMLKSEESSSEAEAEAGSVVDSDPEELPSISLSGLNGSGVDHLAKDDLLDESDTSVSHKEDSDTIKKTDESEEEDAVKSKRRKAQLISSDSEVGVSSRKKNHDSNVKLSDFEDSEDDNSEPRKKRNRKKDNDSDGSVGSSSTEARKKRRRIKELDSDDMSGSDDSENEGRNKHGRKNIRKVMGKNQLEEATKKAAREEKERIARITERQKLYNNLEFDESGKPDEVVLDKVVLDFDPETKEPLIQVDRGLVKKLKPHQANGIKFMWDACFESAKRIKKDRGSGCILAHCMGLGKTLQVVSLTHTLLIHSALTSVNRVLVVCPLSTVLNWVNEFKMWLKHAETDFDVDVYELSRHKQNSERAFQLQQWFEGGGVCVLGYEMFRNLSADNNKKFKKKMLRNFQESLVDPGPDLVVCDEGHLLKNEKTSLSQSMNRVKTRRRIVLTGTPLQNNLKEYYCMVQFVKPNLLGKYNEYLNRFVNPITNGQYTDSTEHDIRIMKRRSHVLHKMLDGAVQRRDYGVLAPFLPPKHEYVLFITLTDVQVKLYQYYLDNYSRRPLPGKSSGFLFPDFQSLQRIWTHPLVLKYNSERYEIMQQKKRDKEEEDSEGSLVDFIDDDSTPDESSTEESSDDLSDASDDSRKKSKKKKSPKKSKGKESKASTRRGTRANPIDLEEEMPTELVEAKCENPTEWWIKLVEEEEIDDMRNSGKLVLLFDILRQCETIGDKLLVFSQSLYSLDLIEHFLGKVDEATQEGRIDEKLGGHVGSWSPGVDYFRLDGSTSCENRSIWCKNFNREDNPRARLFLISTRAGGLGINLVAANRVVIFDVSWNPSHDVQSIFRVYRFGQKKPCYVYRFLAMGTMEEKIYERQVTKQAISKRVIDEQQIDRHYAENDLAELYKFEARPPQPRPIPPLPKDRLFAEMLREHEAQIYKYHEHDSLLENKEEETLSEEERKAAWEDFENEKNRPPPAPFPSAWPMHNGMVPGLLAQQQQLAYAALAAMLRKDMPNINDNQIRDMLPLIYNANPALMQKMGEIYKYTQPGMMNPAMMNPMNAAAGGAPGGVGGAGGGTSGLQYEPPWQRQHQQQQQMRLQQLMQQNQHQQMASMGSNAKYYAGGLGSRDPVAMALQQQRAREIMSGERGRPRGRPPLQPRAPLAPSSGDVVNLDSD